MAADDAAGMAGTDDGVATGIDGVADDADGLADPDGLADADPEGLADPDGLADADPEGLADPDGLADGVADDADGLADADGVAGDAAPAGGTGLSSAMAGAATKATVERTAAEATTPIAIRRLLTTHSFRFTTSAQIPLGETRKVTDRN